MSESGLVGPPLGHVVQTEVDGHISLYDPLAARAHVMNGTASDTWRICDGQHTVEQIVQSLARTYQVDADEIRATVAETVGTFRDQGLIAREDGAA